MHKGIEDMENDKSVGSQLISTDDIDELVFIAQIREWFGKNSGIVKIHVSNSLLRTRSSIIYDIDNP